MTRTDSPFDESGWIPDPPEHLKPKESPARRRFLQILDYTLLVLALMVFPAALEDVSFRYQPANVPSIYWRLVPTLVLAAIGLLRALRMPQWKSRRFRAMGPTCALGIGALVAGFQAWKPSPGPVYFWAGLLSRNPGQTIRMKVHKTSYIVSHENGEKVEDNYATVSLPGAPNVIFEINIGSTELLPTNQEEHDLEGRIYRGAFGLRWIDRETLKVVPDIYKLGAYDRDDKWHSFREFNGRYLIFVAVGGCHRKDADAFAAALDYLQREVRAVVVRFRNNDFCDNQLDQPYENEIARKYDPRFQLYAMTVLPAFLGDVTGMRERHRPFMSLDIVAYNPTGNLLFVLAEGDATIENLRNRMASQPTTFRRDSVDFQPRK